MNQRRRFLVCVLAAALPLGGFLFVAAGSGDEEAASPRLAVLIVFDQMRGDYLIKWEKLFGEGGFRRLQKEGAWFQNCHYPYAHTMTAPGHASLATGTSAYKHGIIDNEWLDRATGK